MTKRARFQVYRSRPGRWYWRLRAANGKIIADGAESYSRKQDALRAANRAQTTAFVAIVAAVEVLSEKRP
jgi:uncharacterized protein YegP (UPF0339 family)